MGRREFAHSTKNKGIKHIVEWRETGLHYTCIGCTSVTPEKIAYAPDEVTCKNCLSRVGRYGEVALARRKAFTKELMELLDEVETS